MTINEKDEHKKITFPRGVIIALVVGLLFFGALMLLNSKPNPKTMPAPDLSFTDIHGDVVSFKDYQGQVVLVNNFAVWCPPCKAEMPELESYYQENKDKGFVILGVEAGQSQESVQLYVQEMGISFPMLLDPDMKSLQAFRLNGLPNSIVIDRLGMVRQTWMGAVDKSFLEKQITPIINE